MFVNVDLYVDFLVQHKMNPEQFLYCYLVHVDRYDLLYKYIDQFKPFDYNDLADLEKRGYIMNLNTEGKTYIDNYIVSDKYTEAIFVDDEAGMEFWELFPNYIEVSGKRLPAKSASKDYIVDLYMKKIKQDRVRHGAIINLLKYAKENGLITMGIKKWVESEQWVAVEQALKEEGEQGHGIDIV